MYAVRRSLEYLRLGVGITSRAPLLFAQIVLMFSIPSLVAAFLAVLISSAGMTGVLLLFLDTVTTIVGPVVFMIAVGAGYRGEVVSFGQVVRQALPWLPRYLWTNVHTSVIFWVPLGGLLLFGDWIEAIVAQTGAPEWVSVLGFVLLVGCLAAYLHSRTLLAPYLAVHSGLPASQAAWESVRLTGHYLPQVVATFLICSAPLAAPTALLLVGLLLGDSLDFVRDEMEPHLIGVGIQLVRLTLIPAAYVLYRQIWDMEEARWQYEGAPPPPIFVRMLLSLTSWLPPLGPMGRKRITKDSFLKRIETAEPMNVGSD